MFIYVTRNASSWPCRCRILYYFNKNQLNSQQVGLASVCDSFGEEGVLVKRGRETRRSKGAPPPLLQGQCYMYMACTANVLHMAPRGSRSVAVFLCRDPFITILELFHFQHIHTSRVAILPCYDKHSSLCADVVTDMLSPGHTALKSLCL